MPRATDRTAKRRLLRDSVLARLRRYISQHALAPGDRLPTEQELARRFGVSRPSVREAIMAMVQLGMLESAPRRGITIGSLDPRRLGECLQMHGAIGAYGADELVRARLVIELGILPFVAHALREDPALLARLRALVDDPALLDDRDRYLAADLELHRSLLQASGIAPITLFNELIAAFFARFADYAAGPDRPGRAFGMLQHRRLLDALAKGELAAAQREVMDGFAHYQPKLLPKQTAG
jgi:GntR family transcriptional repressor for pyruvate dehydrogenase complex